MVLAIFTSVKHHWMKVEIVYLLDNLYRNCVIYARNVKFFLCLTKYYATKIQSLLN